MAQSSDSAMCNKQSGNAIAQNCPILRCRSRNYRFAKKPDVDNHKRLLLIASYVQFNGPMISLAIFSKTCNYQQFLSNIPPLWNDRLILNVI